MSSVGEKAGMKVSERLYRKALPIWESYYEHPFVKGIIDRMNQAKVLRLSDRMILYVSNRNAVKLCMFLSKFIRRIENPSLFLNDIYRLINPKR